MKTEMIKFAIILAIPVFIIAVPRARERAMIMARLKSILFAISFGEVIFNNWIIISKTTSAIKSETTPSPERRIANAVPPNNAVV